MEGSDRFTPAPESSSASGSFPFVAVEWSFCLLLRKELRGEPIRPSPKLPGAEKGG